MDIRSRLLTKKFIIPTVIVLIIAAIAIIAQRSEPSQDVKGDTVTAIEIIEAKKQSSILAPFSLSGIARPQEYTQLRARVSAYVQSLVPIGTNVRAGDVLVVLSDIQISQNYLNAQQAVQEAELSLEETQQLNNETILQAELAVNSARVAFEASERTFENAQLLNNQQLSSTLDSAEAVYESAYNTIEHVVRYWGDGGSLNEFVLRNRPNGNRSLLTDTSNDFERLKGIYYSLNKNIEGNIADALLSSEHALSVARDFNDNVFRTLSYAIAMPELGYTQNSIDAYSAQSQIFTTQINSQNSQVKMAKSSVATIDITNLNSFITVQNQFDQARIQYENALSALESAKRQADIRRIGAQNQLTSAHAQRTTAQARFSDLSIRAPFNGKVLAHYVDRGDQVNSGELAIELGNAQAIEIRLSVDNERSHSLDTGDSALINGTLTGVITEISPSASLLTGSTELSVTAENDARIVPGSSVTVTFDNTITIAPSIILPLSVVTIAQDETYVLIAALNNGGDTDTYVVTKRIVELGNIYGSSIVIVSGLEEGERVIIKNGAFLNEGDEITISDFK